MARLLFLLLATVAVLTTAYIAEYSNIRIRCQHWTTAGDLQTNTVADVLAQTGLSLMDFNLLQGRDHPFLPKEVLNPKEKLCITGYYLT